MGGLSIAQVMVLIAAANPPPTMGEVPSCGVMAVYTIAHHHDKTTTLEHVKTLLSRPVSGTPSPSGPHEHSLEDLRHAVRELGLRARCVRVADDNLNRLTCPSILYLRPDTLGPDERVGHFLVLQSVTKTHVRLVDLTLSPHAWDVSRESLFAEWDGECLEVTDRG
jgi:ABC-type bacteriocin/lantibiotic exporter with double-glycine peptidase domain